MPDKKVIAEEIWLHVNAPEQLDKLVASQTERLRSEARFDDLETYLDDRREIDRAVEEYLSSSEFEKYKPLFLETKEQDAAELVQAVSQMDQTLRQQRGMPEEARDALMRQITEDTNEYDPGVDQEQLEKPPEQDL